MKYYDAFGDEVTAYVRGLEAENEQLKAKLANTEAALIQAKKKKLTPKKPKGD